MVMVTQRSERTYHHSTTHLKLVKTVNFMLYIFYHNEILLHTQWDGYNQKDRQ